MPKARPLIMSGPMVLAYLRGKKAETRRLTGCWQVGDVAWWKEGFALAPCWDTYPPACVVQWGRKSLHSSDIVVFYRANGEAQPGRGRWRSPLHMPRAFSRISTTILEVRREPLHSITEAGAQAEGFASRAEFAAYWDRLHGPGAWDQNPDVLVLRWAPYGG